MMFRYLLGCRFSNTTHYTSPLKTSTIFFIEGFTEEAEFDLVSSDANRITIDGETALAYDLSSNNANIKGQSFTIEVSSGRVIYGIGFGYSNTYSNRWNNEGEAVFTALQESLEIIPITTGSCEVSADSTYGYTQDNPVKLSSDTLNGYSYEKQYLNNLRGSNGEAVSYKRMDSITNGLTRLAQYEVTYGNISIILYLDDTGTAMLYAPVGFTCWGKFNMTNYY